MCRRSIVVFVLGLLGSVLLADVSNAYHSPNLGRWINRDPIGERGGTNLHAFVANNPADRIDPHGQQEWSRELKWGPRFLNDGKVGYKVKIYHILPPVPDGSKQLWQVFSCASATLSKSGVLEMKRYYVVDKVNIRGRAEISDTLSLLYVPNEDDYCLWIESCGAVIGFSDPEVLRWIVFPDDESSGVVSEEQAQKDLSDMLGPKGHYSQSYVYYKKANCCKGLQRVLNLVSTQQEGERLFIEGAGCWTSDLGSNQ